MDLEVESLLKQQTWQLTKLPNNRKALKGRWVYKLKTNKLGEIVKYKARFVVKGFSQVYGLDYLETFANTTRPEVIKLLIYYAYLNNLVIRQWDFKNAFLHADIDEEIYIEQPIGYLNNKNIINNNYNNYNKIVEQARSSNLVYKLNKALYSLKQSPRLWYNYLSNKLKQLDFIPIILEQGVFINNNLRTIIIVYVDDILVLSPTLEIIEDIKTKLKNLNLDLEDLGEASYFLGIEININKYNLSLSQEKYCKNILERYNKQDLIPVLSPTEPGIKLEKSTSLASNLDINKY
jgi:hypothetical protein